MRSAGGIARKVLVIRFTLVLAGIATVAVALSGAIWYTSVVSPATTRLSHGMAASSRCTGSLAALLEVATAPDVPAEQRAQLAMAHAQEMATHSLQATALLRGALERWRSVGWALLSGGAGVAVALALGWVWAQRVARAQDLVAQRMDALVEGNLRLESLRRAAPDLPIVVRTLQRVVEELRAMARRQEQMVGEAADAVARVLEDASRSPGLDQGLRQRLCAAAQKVRELERMAQRNAL